MAATVSSQPGQEADFRWLAGVGRPKSACGDARVNPVPATSCRARSLEPTLATTGHRGTANTARRYALGAAIREADVRGAVVPVLRGRVSMAKPFWLSDEVAGVTSRVSRFFTASAPWGIGAHRLKPRITLLFNDL